MNFEVVPSVLSAVAALILGALVASKGLRRVANLTFAAGAAGLAVMELGYSMVLALEPSPTRMAWARAAVVAEVLMMPAWALFSVTFASADPASRLRRWRWLLGFAGAASLALLAAGMRQPFIVPLDPDPFGGRILALTSIGKWAETFSLAAAVFVLFQLESTLRNSSGLPRWAIKYFVLGLLGIFSAHVFVLSQRLLYGTLPVSHLPAQSAICLLSFGLMVFGLIRNQLLDVNVFFSRNVAYRSVAVGAVGVYLLALGLTGELTWRLEIFPDFFLSAILIFVTAVALAAGLLSETARRRVRRAISANFYRHKYDYRQEWAEFTSKVSSAGGQGEIPAGILGRVTETMGIREGAIWLLEEGKRWRLAASAGLPSEGLSLTIDPALLSRAAGNGRPVILLEAAAPFANGSSSSLRDRYLTTLVPLIAKGEVVGLLALGSPAGGRLTLEDEDLLATIAAQAATVILSARLSEELARSREMEAFHRLSSFVLHDLKNCVAMLSLVTQNAGTHGSDPAFQRDALKTVGESVKQMRELIGKLSGGPKRLEPVPRPTDLNAVVREVLARGQGASNGRVKIREELDDSVGAVLAGGDAIRTVVSNLFVNAVEAVQGKGEVSVKTFRNGATATVMVADTGRGMPEAFLRDSLFVPFRTTKPKGLGIGLYQVKSIVEGLGGRIRVESLEGKGTTFRVEFPAPPASLPPSKPEMTKIKEKAG